MFSDSLVINVLPSSLLAFKISLCHLSVTSFLSGAPTAKKNPGP